MGEVRLTILGSGSAGNAAFIESDHTCVLVDCGLSASQIRLRLAGIGRSPDRLDAILITHEHSDHIAGIKTLAGKLNIPVYCNRQTGEEIKRITEARLDFRFFETGASFEVGEIGVETYSVPHDTNDPVGYLLHTPAGRIGFLTDLGHTNRMLAHRLREVNVLSLETNHDVKMLQDDPHRPWALKQRILGRHGHLSNVAATEFAQQIMHADLRQIYCAHLSSECNTPALARDTLRTGLDQIGASHVNLTVATQSEPCPTYFLRIELPRKNCDSAAISKIPVANAIAAR